MKNELLDDFFEKPSNWHDELNELRKIVLETGLIEELKWKQPCYTMDGTNLLMVSSFKDFAFVSFLNGSLLADSENILVKPGENSQFSRLMRFKNVEEIKKLKPTLLSYMYEMIEAHKAGIKPITDKNKELDFPEELLLKFEKDTAFKAAFEALTPGRQRAYNIYFTGAKQSKARESRIENYTQRIMNGKGFNDCVCGMSKKMPGCDGSHKYIT
ncbi:MAG: YdeI/OmpD-associated family protein [Leadbetterella sp.]|nr:YdeI/OmpD-associated family protein [Leadbetterella sp.]